MAYYDYDDGYDDGYVWPQDHAAYNVVGYQDSVSFSGYESYHPDNAYTVPEFQEPQFLDYYHQTQDYDYDYDHEYSLSSSTPGINYFAYNYVEPKLIAYEPVSCDTGYVSYHTHYSISYPETDLQFNEPEFEEYDPTPYGGGYDIVSVYGKPLPPSDQTCYPRSNPKPVEPKSKPAANSIPLANPKSDPKVAPMSKPEPEPVHVPALMPMSKPKPEPEPELEPEPAVHVPILMAEPLESREESNYPDYGFDYPWPEYDHGYGTGVGYDYGYGKQVVQIPPFEYSPEVVELCENLFGSWPCLAKIRKEQMGVINNPGISTCPEDRHLSPWETCASYIFGTKITKRDI